MTKLEFLTALRNRLEGLPPEEVEERLTFYAEMIEDRVEEGSTEEDAVAAVGTVEEIASQILSDIPLAKMAKEKIKKRRHLRAWEIVLLAVGSPIWLSLLVGILAILFSLYASLWVVIASLWAVFGAFVACGPAAVIVGGVLAIVGTPFTGLALVGVGLVLAGLAIFSFFGCKGATEGLVWLTKKIILAIKRCFVRKEKVQ